MSWSLVVYSVDLVAAYAGCTWKTMITYSFGVPTQRRCGDLSLADVGIVGEDSSHGIRRSGGSKTFGL